MFNVEYSARGINYAFPRIEGHGMLERLKQILQNTKAYNVSNKPLSDYVNLIYVSEKELSSTRCKFSNKRQRKTII